MMCFVVTFVFATLAFRIAAMDFSLSTSGVAESQYVALYGFFQSLNMDSPSSRPWHNWFLYGLQDESDEDYCIFTGVECDSEGFVKSLDLSQKRLVGTIPDMRAFVRLKLLKLGQNKISGSIPESLVGIESLEYVYLGHNYITGPVPNIPPSSVIRRLTLTRNSLSGTIPTSLCHLSLLNTLDLTGNQLIRGKLPDCLADLPELERLRLADTSLTGAIPFGLCDVREMNGLTPNRYGCDAIGCAAGTYQPAGGRQSSAQTACLACDVPSNVIASTRCHWLEMPSDEPSDQPSDVPSLSPVSLPSSLPTALVLSYAKPSLFPSALPTAFEETGQPTLELSNAVSGIADDGGPLVSPPHAGGIVAGTVVVLALVGLGSLFLAKMRKRRQREMVGDGDVESNVDEAASDLGSSIYEDELIQQPLPIRSPTKRTSLIQPSMLANLERGDPSPARVTSRRVRFSLPEPRSASTDGHESCSDDEKTLNSNYEKRVVPNSSARERPNAEQWASWIMNPFLVAPNLCSTPNRASGEPAVTCMPTTSSPSNSASPLLPQVGPSNLAHFCLETSSRQHDGASPVLGIQDRRDMIEAGLAAVERAGTRSRRPRRRTPDTVTFDGTLSPIPSEDEENTLTNLGLAEI